MAQLLTESVALGLLGGLAGLALAYWGGGVLRATLLPDVDWSGGTLDGRMLAVTAAAALTAGVLAGLAPAVQSTAPAVGDALKTGMRAGASRRSGTRTALLVAQVALSVVLLTGAGLFVRSLQNARSLDLGFEPARVLYASVEMRGAELPRAEQTALARRMMERAAELPQVEYAAATRSVPFWMTWQEDLFVPGIDSVSRLGDFLANAVTADYFATMGTRILRGRGITAEDGRGAPLAVVVSETMAATLWPAADPIGRCIKVGADTAPCATVVGVAQDIRTGSFGESERRHYYLSSAQREGRGGGLLVRTRGDAAGQLAAVRRELQRLMPGAAFVSARPLQELVDVNIRPWRLGATMFAVFGGLALLLAAVGLYGVIAFDVGQRMHEMGVRVALGAQRRDVLRLVLLEGVRLAAVGVALGSALALLGGRYLAALLFQVSPRDPLVLVAGGLTLLAVAVAASVLPALRAVRVDPNVALRAD
jgi:predicted permease